MNDELRIMNRLAHIKYWVLFRICLTYLTTVYLTTYLENIIFSLAVKFICLILAAFGFANMWWAVFSDVGVMVIAVLNATRMLRPMKLEE